MTISVPCEGASPWTFDCDESSRLLLESWGELLDPESPDSFRARLFDLPTILQELAEVCERSISSPRWEKHVDAVREEVAQIAAGESKWLEGHSKLRFLIDSAVKCQSTKETRRLTRLALAEFGDPQIARQEDLERWLGELPKHKERVLHRLGTLATHAVRSQVDFLTLTAPLSDVNVLTAEPREVVRAILSTMQPKTQTYKCVLAVAQAHTGDVQAVVKGSAITPSSAKHVSAFGEVASTFAARHITDVLVQLDVTAAGDWLAATDAYRKLSWHADILNFYSHEDSLTIGSVVLIVDSSGMGRLVDLSQNPQLKPRKARRKLTLETASTPHQEVLEGQVRAALEQYSIAVNAKDTRVALSTMWTALETLVGPFGPDAVHDRIVHWVAPVVAWRRTGKILTYICIQLHQLGVGTSRVPMAPLMPRTTASRVSLTDTCCALVEAADGKTICRLLDVVASSPLLRFRLYSQWKIFQDPLDVASSLENSMRRVAWNLLRVYRARNLSVHYGQRVALDRRLYEHLHYYFSVVASAILSTLRKNPTWDSELALESIRQRYFETLRQLRESPETVAVDDLVPVNGENGTKLWPR